MTRQQILPTIIILISLGASTVCLWDGDWRRAGYWAAAAFVNLFATI